MTNDMAAYTPHPAGPKTSGLAIASLVLGILGILTTCLTVGVLSLLAVILGHIGRSEVKRSGGALAGSGLATAGLVLGYLGLALPVVLLLYLGHGWGIAPFMRGLF